MNSARVIVVEPNAASRFLLRVEVGRCHARATFTRAAPKSFEGYDVLILSDGAPSAADHCERARAAGLRVLTLERGSSPLGRLSSAWRISLPAPLAQVGEALRAALAGGEGAAARAA